VDNASLSFIIATPPTRGTLARSGSATGPGLIYTPARDFVGRDSFSFRASDGSAESEVVTVSITVGGQNDAPIAVADTASTSEDTPLNIRVLGNDTDADGDTLRVVRVATTSATRGTVSINSDGTLRFVPEADFNGSATFSYTIADAAQGGLEAALRSPLQVLAVTMLPLLCAEREHARGDTARDHLSAQDVDSSSLSFVVVTPPRNGTLTGSGATRRYVPATTSRARTRSPSARATVL
jgi:hypothetical protein